MLLKNEDLTVNIAAFGAELKSIKNKSGHEFLWQGLPEFWAKTSPFLFPIVGSLVNNSYIFNSTFYNLPRHGFARDFEFKTIFSNSTKVVFCLTESEETLKNYPFKFNLFVTYELCANELKTSYLVENTGLNTMYFSLGAHPAFSFNNLDLNTYVLEFDNDEVLEPILLNNGLLSSKKESIALNQNKLQLSYELFNNDALVFRDLKSSNFKLKNTITTNEIEFSCSSYTHFGIWSAKNANFVCLEPWCGVADNENHNQDFTIKEGINTLQPKQTFSFNWCVRIK